MPAPSSGFSSRHDAHHPLARRAIAPPSRVNVRGSDPSTASPYVLAGVPWTFAPAGFRGLRLARYTSAVARLIVWGGAMIAGLAATGCPSSDTFICLEDSECGAQGTCEAAGFCGFPDERCPSGRRYEPLAGDGLASRCVPLDDGETGGLTGSTTISGSTTGSMGSQGETTSGPTTGPSTTSGDATPSIEIDPQTRFQPLDGMGIQAWDFPIVDPDWNWDAAALAFDEVDIHYVQLITIFSDWEPDNDNADPFSTNDAAFDPSGEVVTEDIAMGQWMVARGYELNVQKVLLPGWMTIEDYEVPPEQYAEFAESVISYQAALEMSGIHQTELDLWQAGTEADAFKTPAAAAEAADELLNSLDVFGLERKLLTPSVPGSIAEEWLSVWFESQERSQRTAAVSVRGAATSQLADFQAVATWGEKFNVPIWGYDNWYCGPGEGCPAAPATDSTTWASAWEMAQQNYRLIVGAHASRIYHAAMVGFQPSLDPATGAKLPTFHVLQHFANWIPPGSVLLSSTPDNEAVLSVAVERPDGSFGLILLNTDFVEVDVDVSLATGQALTLGQATQSIAGEYMTPLASTGETGQVFSLPPSSISSIEFLPR